MPELTYRGDGMIITRFGGRSVQVPLADGEGSVYVFAGPDQELVATLKDPNPTPEPAAAKPKAAAKKAKNGKKAEAEGPALEGDDAES